MRSAVRPVRRGVQLTVSCVVLGFGVALLLDARLGSDGYSTFINGLALVTGVGFWAVNIVVGVVLIAVGWLRGRRPGVGTVAQPILVGIVVSVALPLLPAPTSMPWRWVELLVAFAVLCVGVAGYLAVDLGAGPTEVAALAWDPPVPFRWSYSFVQIIGAGTGWLMGASLGLGTVLVVLLIGPVVDLLMPLLGTPAERMRS